MSRFTPRKFHCKLRPPPRWKIAKRKKLQFSKKKKTPLWQAPGMRYTNIPDSPPKKKIQSAPPALRETRQRERWKLSPSPDFSAAEKSKLGPTHVRERVLRPNIPPAPAKCAEPSKQISQRRIGAGGISHFGRRGLPATARPRRRAAAPEKSCMIPADGFQVSGFHFNGRSGSGSKHGVLWILSRNSLCERRTSKDRFRWNSFLPIRIYWIVSAPAPVAKKLNANRYELYFFK